MKGMKMRKKKKETTLGQVSEKLSTKGEDEKLKAPPISSSEEDIPNKMPQTYK